MKLIKKALFALGLAVLPIKAGYQNLYVGDTTDFQGYKVSAVDCHGYFNGSGIYEHHALLSIDDYLYKTQNPDSNISLEGIQYRIVNGDKFYTGLWLDTVLEAKKPVLPNVLLNDNKGRDTIVGNEIMRFDTVLDAEKRVRMWINDRNLDLSLDSNYNIDNIIWTPSLLWGWKKNTSQLPQRYFVRLNYTGDLSTKKYIIPITGERTVRKDGDSSEIEILTQPDNIGYMRIRFNQDTLGICEGTQIREMANFYGVLDSIRQNGGNKYAVFDCVFLSKDSSRMFLNQKEGWYINFNNQKDTIWFDSYDSATGILTLKDDFLHPKFSYQVRKGDTLRTDDGLELYIDDCRLLKGQRIGSFTVLGLDRGETSVKQTIKGHIPMSKPVNYYDLLGRKVSSDRKGLTISENKRIINFKKH